MTEEQQCYYIVRDDGSMTFYLHGGNGAHLVLADTLDVSAQLANRDATISQWYATGDAIMHCATGKIAMLSDSDVCGVINDLRAQVATLTERLDRCTCTDDYGDVAE